MKSTLDGARFIEDQQRIWAACRDELLSERDARGAWVGELSSSALATATAVSALTEYRRHTKTRHASDREFDQVIECGIEGLVQCQNQDGGWGDTDRSHSNISTTMLVAAAFTLAERQGELASEIQRANAYIEQMGGVPGLRARYGTDKTFAVPILANCAIAGVVPWDAVDALPFEAALVPLSCYRMLRLPVVSYAIPALVAIGQAKFLKDPPWNPFAYTARRLALSRGLNVLKRMQPSSGGYLEAIPLTSFVCMSLAHTGRADHQVTRRGIGFLLDTFRRTTVITRTKLNEPSELACDEPDTEANPADRQEAGVWPIDTNLATWNTTLAVNALGPALFESKSAEAEASGLESNHELLTWVLGCQYRERHPFTGADPGGWGWSDLSGAVPDGDDTPGALLALRYWWDQPDSFSSRRPEILEAAAWGVLWLLRLQNRDGGWPTFCRGWGKLPFDRSGSDLTAHVLRAFCQWRDDLATCHSAVSVSRIDKAMKRGFAYLAKRQCEDGSWVPLWFGNQDTDTEENRVYGTAKVVMAYRDTQRMDRPEAQRGLLWLVEQQNDDGGWGGGPSCGTVKQDTKLGCSSLQETALAVEALCAGGNDPQVLMAKKLGLTWIIRAIEDGKSQERWPIGFYFAKLWYYERLYPLLFSVSALRRALESDRSSKGGEIPLP